ncbi:MAG: SpaH/EbpB family LPXTG-anchored major pilin [Lachnospiraceae bacterium]|nr:SpaH/EbpB family LPXTG-anchored major pilin [Lachnospiraceae bacterium]
MRNKSLFKRAFGMLLAFALTASMIIPAQVKAAPTIDDTQKGKLTIHKTDQDQNLIKGAGYTLYKVADITQTSGKMEYTSNVAGVTVTSTTSPSVFESYIQTGSLQPVGSEQVTDGTNDLVFSNLDLGVYLVKETTTPDGVIASNDFLVSLPMTDTDANGDQYWNYEITATPKNNVFDGALSKTISNGAVASGNDDNAFSADVGKTVTYTISARVPEDFYISGDTGRKYTQLDLYDIPSNDGIEIDMSSIKVVISDLTGDTDITNDVTIEKGTPAVGGYTANANRGFTLSFVEGTDPNQAPVNAAVVAGSTIVATYDAVVSSNIVGDPVTNHILGQYDYPESGGHPGTVDPDPDTPEPVLSSYGYALFKVNENNTALNTAEFIVKDENGKYLHFNATSTDYTQGTWSRVDEADATVFTSGNTDKMPLAKLTADGRFEISGVAAGTYEVIEVNAPTGYTLLKTPVSIQINETSTSHQQQGDVTVYDTKITNVKGFELPGTGGKGTVLYLASGVIVILFGIFMVLKAKKAGKKN